MRILRIIYDWPPPWDGLAPHPYEITQSQVKLGHTFDIFCGSWPNHGSIAALKGVVTQGFLRELVPGTLIFTNALAMFIYYLFWRQTHTPDLIHIHGHFGYWIYVYRKFLKKNFPNSLELKIPLVAHFHNTVEGRWKAAEENNADIKPESKYMSWPLAKQSDQMAVELADACIFVSNDTRQQAIDFYGANPSKCFVVETGVNTNLFRPVGGEEYTKSRDELGFDNLDKVVCNNGAMVERKNIHLLVETMKYLPKEYKLLLVGPGDPSYLQRIDLLIKSNSLQDRVVRAGYTPYPQIPVAFQVADIFVLPSTFEGIPKVVMQSLACGTPVLASGFKLDESIRGLNYISDLDPKKIADQILEVVKGGKNVDIDKIITLYSWDLKARQVEEVYKYVFQKRV